MLKKTKHLDQNQLYASCLIQILQRQSLYREVVNDRFQLKAVHYTDSLYTARKCSNGSVATNPYYTSCSNEGR